MRPATLIVSCVLAMLTVAALTIFSRHGSMKPHSLNYTAAEEEPVCPWREPEADLRSFFPDATSHHLETKMLSAMRPQLTRILGRQPTGADHSLRINRVYVGTNVLGSVLTRRVKGEHGAIELVIALSTNGVIRGVRTQRSREPREILQAIDGNSWLASLTGKSVTNECVLGKDLPQPAIEAHTNAQAIADGVRTTLTVFSLAEISLVAHTTY